MQYGVYASQIKQILLLDIYFIINNKTNKDPFRYLSFQLGIQASTPAEFLLQAKRIVLEHKELEGQVSTVEQQIKHVEKISLVRLYLHLDVIIISHA